jgi:hypothetical protein
MKNIKFVVRVTRGAARAPCLRAEDSSDPRPADNQPQAGTDVMGKITAEDAVKSIQHPGCSPELVPVQVAV